MENKEDFPEHIQLPLPREAPLIEEPYVPYLCGTDFCEDPKCVTHSLEAQDEYVAKRIEQDVEDVKEEEIPDTPLGLEDDNPVDDLVEDDEDEISEEEAYEEDEPLYEEDAEEDEENKPFVEDDVEF